MTKSRYSNFAGQSIIENPNGESNSGGRQI